MQIEEMIKEALANPLREDKPRDNTYIHCSAVGDCRRRQGYSLTGVTPLKHPDNLLHVFDVGNAIHTQLQKRLVDMGWCHWKDIEVHLHDPELKVGGTCDAVTLPLEEFGGKRYIIDIKTITAKPKVNRDPEGNLYSVEKSSYEHLDKPKTNHLMQVNLYSWLWARSEGQLGWGVGGEYPDLMLIYVAKDTGWEQEGLPYKIFVQPFDQDLLDVTLKRATYIHKKIEDKVLPAKDFYYTQKNRDWHCASCNFRNTCLPQFFGEQGELIG